MPLTRDQVLQIFKENPGLSQTPQFAQALIDRFGFTPLTDQGASPPLASGGGVGATGLGADPFLVGGGQAQTGQFLDAFQAAEAAGLGRSQLGLGFLNQMIDVQRDPFSIVPALQAYGGVGGGTLAPNVAFAQTGGAGFPSPYGAIADRLIQGLSQFVGAGSPTEVSPTPSASPVSDVSSVVQKPVPDQTRTIGRTSPDGTGSGAGVLIPAPSPRKQANRVLRRFGQ